MDKFYLDLIRYRESMYRLFASLYIEELDKEMLKKLLKLKLPRIRQAEQSWQMDFNAGYELFEKYLEGFKGLSDKDTEARLEDLAADYAKIFLAAGEASGKAAFPYESVYVGHDSEFGGSIQTNLHALYLSKGLQMKEDMFKIMDDHIGLEFNYMAELLAVQAAAVSEGAEEVEKQVRLDEIAFFKDHLLTWVTSFTNDVYKYADRDFYKGLARMTSGFLGFEQAVLKDKGLA